MRVSMLVLNLNARCITFAYLRFSQVKKLTWKGAVTKVQAAQQADDATYSFIGDKVENVPSLLEER